MDGRTNIEKITHMYIDENKPMAEIADEEHKRLHMKERYKRDE